MERHLAAIMAADLAGYSRLMEKDEAGTLRRLQKLRSDILQPLFAKHRGRLVKQTGDGFLVDFGSAVNAVLCAQDLQTQLAGPKGEPGYRFRIGLHLGDVIVEDGDIYGGGVNIAARLEQIAPVGGIALSEALYEQIEGKVSGVFKFEGRQQLKNIERPVGIWLLHANGANEDATLGPPTGANSDSSDTPSMAVLPFANLTGDPSQDYLALGIADQLITTLGQVPWFFVSAPMASFAAEFKSAPKSDVARRLGVRYLIGGSLQKAGTRLRVSVHLTEADKGRQIWSEQFSDSVDNLFELQDRMAKTVIGAIEPRMRQLEIRRSQTKHGSLSAFDHYLRALPHIRGMTKADFDSGLAHLENATAMNPTYAAAHGLIAWLMTLRVPQGQHLELESGLFHAEQAIQHGQGDSEALSTGGYALGYLKWDPELGIQYLRESITLNPNSARTYDFAGWLWLYAGKAEEALEHFDHSLDLSPIDDFAFRALTGKAFALLFLRQLEAAVAVAKRALTANPNFTPCHRVLAPALALSGSAVEARKVVEDLLAHYPSLTVSRFAEETRFVDPTYKATLLDGLRRAGLPA